MSWVLVTQAFTTRGYPRGTGSRHMNLTIFLFLSAVLAVAVGVLASLLLRSLMKVQNRLEDSSQRLEPKAGALPKNAEHTSIRQEH